MRPFTRPLTRRAVLRGTVGLGAIAVAPTLLAACGRDASGSTASGHAGGGPDGGGIVRVGAIGSPSDVLDPGSTVGFADYLTLFHLYDSLALMKGGRIELSLAERLEPNGDATAWTIRLVDGATFHDGRPVRAADVLASLAHLVASSLFGQLYADVDVAASRAVDDRTIELRLRRPRADLVEAAFSQMSMVFPEGTSDFTAGIGSGPFRLERYEPGSGAVLVRNDDYWGDVALLDGIEVMPIADATARLNALKSGELDYAVGISPAAAAAEAANEAIVIRRGGPANSQALVFEMNVTVPPFDDPDVRLAFKLAIDRQSLVDTVLLGQGTVGNDLLGNGLPGYAEDIPQRRRDVARARRLLEDKDVEGIRLRAADLLPGIVDSAEVLTEQLAEVGVRASVEEVPADTYFDDMSKVTSTPFQAMYYINRPIASTIYTYTGAGASFNPTGFASPDYDRILADVQRTTDPDARAALLHEAQSVLHAEGGDLVWGYQEQLDASVPGLDGVELTQSIPLLTRATR